MTTVENILEQAKSFRSEIGGDLHDRLTEAVYTDASAIAGRVVSVKNQTSNFHLDQTLDRILTSRLYGFPLMILMLTIVLWLTIERECAVGDAGGLFAGNYFQCFTQSGKCAECAVVVVGIFN